MKNVIVLGAGLAGLGFARTIPRARVYEAKSHPGGHAYSHPADGLAFDEGAHICHSRDGAWLRLITRAAGRVERIPQSRVTNFWHGEWVTYPVQNNLADLPLIPRVQALTGFLHAQVEFRGRIPRNYEQWCRFQYGDYLTDQFYALYTAKYWRVPMSDLSTDWISGRLIPSQVDRIIAGALAPQEEQQSTFARFRYPAHGGFFAFVRPLYDRVNAVYNARAVAVDAGRRIVEFSTGERQRYDALASSIPLPELVRMTRGAPASVRAAAAKLRHVQLLCVNLVIRRPRLSPAHWFYIYDPDIEASRVSVISNLAPRSVPRGATVIQAEVFRGSNERVDAGRLTAKTVKDLARVLGFDPEKDVERAVPVRAPYAYVISDLDRARAVAHATGWLRRQRIFPMGLFGGWKFIWSDAAFRSGVETARTIREM